MEKIETNVFLKTYFILKFHSEVSSLLIFVYAVQEHLFFEESGEKHIL